MTTQTRERMPLRGRRAAAGVATSTMVGGVLLGALFGVALIGSAPSAAWAASDCDRDWSVTQSDGAPINSSTMFADALVAPGASLDGEFLVTTGRDIRGPLDLRAVRSDTAPALDAALERDIRITLSGSSRAVTMQLQELLDASDPVRVIDTLTPGAHSIGITVELPFGSTNATQFSELPFQLMVTVSDQQTVIGAAPAECIDLPSGGSGGSGGLASTGAQTAPMIAWAAALGGVGLAIVVASRRKRPERETEPQTRDS
ncbi:LPXTG-motif cell wall-anchored protein [Microterricola gilva]|uniref:LPXTG-motif cell wall-anchored protein n=1 Tax=Microterricola gilva TaxID=393267 RepID=A0A4Q8AQQ9_9MICO|nr:LPXTG cell wall anchor domain-containing protein [Microterricola gilva]RZU67070.1 LPXTG-motif cell wall-anchored protein [Microterricola gilva]